MEIYPDWEAAAKASKWRKAVSTPVTITIPRGTFRMEMVKPLHGDPYAVYATAPGIRVHDYKPSTREIDRIRRWKPW